MDHTQKLATFCTNLTFDDLPSDVITKTKLCILDYIANIYGSLELKAVNDVIGYFRSQNVSGIATALGCGFKTNLNHAAFINGVTAEAIEAQDGYRFGGNHPGVAVIPAAIGTAEEKGASGRQVIEAVIAGYESANRPAAAMHPWHTLSGVLPTGTCGAFGAAAAAAKIYQFDEKAMLNAIGNAGYLLPLSMAEHLMGGFTIKIVQGGQAASAGIMAAGLAGRGLTGSPQVLEGSHLNGGFTKITSAADPKFEKLSEGLGETYSISDIYFKPYTACRHTHGAAQAALELTGENDFSLKDIAAINVYTYGIAELAVGKGVKKNDSFVSAQFSIPYVVAACLTDGELGPLQLTEKRMADEDLLRLSEKVFVKTDEALNQLYPEKTSSRVEIALNDNRIFKKQIDIPKGDPRDPMTEKDIVGKVNQYAGKRDSGNINKVISMVLSLEDISDIYELTRLI
jgi:2-methylcitrate dehydratase PrpD